MRKVYLDNAATSFPKPPGVVEAMVHFMNDVGANPGRGAYDAAFEAGRIIFEARQLMAELVGAGDPSQIIFTSNVTTSLNIALKGLLKQGSHVITTSMEHNSVMRVLYALEKTRGIEVSRIKCSEEGFLNPHDVRRAIRTNTTAIVMTHASNVTGTLMPIEEIGRIAYEHGLFYIIDTAQTAGVYQLDVKALHADVLAFTGHKGLMGPQGTGGFYVRQEIVPVMDCLIEGGTGSKSSEEQQPGFLPDKYESGTPNTVGIAGLAAGVRFIRQEGLDRIRLKEEQLAERLIAGLLAIEGVTVYGPRDCSKRTGTVSIGFAELDEAEVSFILAREYGIMTRTGLHCAPSAHRTIGTFPKGTLRFSIGYFNTEEEIDYTLESLKKAMQVYLQEE